MQLQTPTPQTRKPIGTTLLELVTRLNDVTADEHETVEAALALLEDGTYELTGNFKGCRLS